MPWPTTAGDRILVGAEAKLVRGAIGMMVDSLVAECRHETGQQEYGIDWFDQWDARQRLWLLEIVTRSMFTSFRIDSSAAMFDAAAHAVFFELLDLIQTEIEQDSDCLAEPTWRQSVIAARSQQTNRAVEIDKDENDLILWQKIVTRIADDLLGMPAYQKAQIFRDGEFHRTEAFLQSRGLPSDYLQRIPDLRSVDQTQQSIDQIQAVVFPTSGSGRNQS